MVQVRSNRHTRHLTDGERTALREFAKLGIPVGEFLARLSGMIVVHELAPGQRQISVQAVPDETIAVTRDDIRWVVQRYLRGKMSGEELSNWAGLLLAISAYVLPANDDDDDVLELLNDDPG